MIVEKRTVFGKLSILLIPTSEEADLIEEVLGSKVVDDDGLIATVEGEYRLADGYGPAYIKLVHRIPE